MTTTISTITVMTITITITVMGTVTTTGMTTRPLGGGLHKNEKR